MIIKRFNMAFVLAALLVAGGCANDTGSSPVTLGYAPVQSAMVETGDGSASDFDYKLLNKTPKVLIAKPKKRRTAYRPQGRSMPIVGSTDTKDGSGPAREQETVMRVPEKDSAGIDHGNPYGSLGSGPSGNADINVAQPDYVFPDIITPVATTAHGDSVIVIKSINGGFGIMLLKQGVDQNQRACKAFFNALPTKALGEVEKAAQSSQGLFRPTYWLDRRPEKDLERPPVYRTASAKPDYVTFLFSQGKGPANATAASRDCPSKVANYNYSVSHALLNRLGLLERRGPFLAAWRDDGGKAMVLDMSQFESDLDFNEALESWMKMIVRRPQLWEPGIHNASFRQKLRRLLNKGGDTILSLLVPSSVEARP